jgi:flagellar biosynthesis protein
MKTPKHKSKSAAALKYDGINAPTLIAKGQADIAEKIIAEAKAHNIHIHQDPVLLSVLSQLDLGQEIPHQLYLAVAKIIAFAYFLQGKHPDYNTNNESYTTDITDKTDETDEYTTQLPSSQLLSSNPSSKPSSLEKSSKNHQKKLPNRTGNGQYLTKK